MNEADVAYGRGRAVTRRMPWLLAGLTVSLDSVRDDLAGVVHEALEPTLLSVWTNEPW
jgi:hypothetical protein